MSLGEENKILEQISQLKQQHSNLEEKIANLSANTDQMNIQRLKKEKLTIKDSLIRLHSLIEPDIIA